LVIKTVKILFLLFFIVGCSTKNGSIYKLDNKHSLTLGKTVNPTFINLNNSKLRYHNISRCIDLSYTLKGEDLKYGNIFIEYIDLYQNCHWNGLPSGFFISNLKQQLKIDDIEIVENYEIDGYDFTTLKIDNDSFLSVIYIYSSSKDIFILDYKGVLYDKLLKSFKKDYKNIYINKKRFMGNYDNSLARKNIIENYFSVEIENRL